jgi:hypothetical protein
VRIPAKTKKSLPKRVNQSDGTFPVTSVGMYVADAMAGSVPKEKASIVDAPLRAD